MAIEDVKTIRIFKSYGGAGTRGEFSNTYHALSPGSLKDAGLVALAKRLLGAEKAITSNKVFFSRIVITTYARKSAVGGADKPYIIPIGELGVVDLTPDNNGLEAKVLPAEGCLVMNFSGGLGRPGRHTYRYAISEDGWINSGEGVSLLPVTTDRAFNAWKDVLNANGGVPPLVFITEDEDGQPTDPVTSITYGGFGLKQLTQKKGKKKGKDVFDIDTNTEDDAEREMAQAVEVITDIMQSRYTTAGAAILASGAFAGAIAALQSASNSAKNAIDTSDYGPPALPPAGP